MKMYLLINLALLTAVGAMQMSCSQPESTEKETVKAASAGYSKEEVLRGEYLVSIMGCNDCHSPKIMGANGPELDPERKLSGHPANMPLELSDVDVSKIGKWVMFDGQLTAAVGPWGTSYGANITSDATGIGNWTEEQFFNAIRKGMYKGQPGGRMILPPMPWQEFANLTDEDVRAIFAYLKTVKPVKNVPPAPIPLEAFNN